MKKFLVVGVGGSGGATLRYAMDQLRADLRAHGIREIPAAWQFMQIDVKPTPEYTAGLGSTRDLGGRYVSVSSPGNLYDLVAGSVERGLDSAGSLRSLIGWEPRPRHEANSVNITNGAGQYRAIGRMLMLTRLRDIQDELNKAWEQLQRPDAWGQLPEAWPEGGPYQPDAEVVPIVVGSMAGGSGAAMFLDVCRLLGRIPGLVQSTLGVFLFTPDVFAGLETAMRTGVDGNALGALGDVMATQTRASDLEDADLFTALGLPPETVNEPAFARVFPIGASIGGDGAKFGDGSPEGVFRGLGRAMAATIGSDAAAWQYLRSKVENPSPTATITESFGWGIDPAFFCWGSFGYASLSLGRDRYAEYASQRLARNAVDRLLTGFLSAQSQLPPEEQLAQLLENQWSGVLDRLEFPQPGASIKQWLTGHALRAEVSDAEARGAINEADRALTSTQSMQASTWVGAIRANLNYYQQGAAEAIRKAAYRWANGWAGKLEAEVREEFLKTLANPKQGLPYARQLTRRLRRELNPIIDQLRAVPPMPDQPLTLSNELSARADQLKRAVVDSGHPLADEIRLGYLASAKNALEREAARLAAEVLASYCEDVLGSLERSASTAMVNLEAARDAVSQEAGLAQLETATYREWPLESEQVPSRFDHADNEVLLTTALDFPAQFHNDIERTVPGVAVYETALERILSEIMVGRWESTGGQPSEIPVLTQRVEWRAPVLISNPLTDEPTPRSQPVYDLALSTEELLARARTYQQRPDTQLMRFSSETFEGYLNDPTLADSERRSRLDGFVRSFRQTMMLARPLTGVSPSMIQAMHPGNSLTYEFSFGTIALGSGSQAATQIQSMLDADQELDNATVRRFTDALVETSTANRIAIFGSYPKYTPLVYSSFLDQVQRRWAGATDPEKRDLWKWKRTRNLPGALAMGAAEQRALIKGWFLGRMLGLLSQPTETTSADPVQVWDVSARDWKAFPTRLLTARDRYRGADDWLPGILEGHTMAIVGCNNDTSLLALAPYVALRRIADDAPQPSVAFDGTSGDRLVRDWIKTGAWPSGRASEVNAIAALSELPPMERAEGARAWVESVRDYFGTTYLTDGSGIGSLGVRRARIASTSALAEAPMALEIAHVAYAVLDDLSSAIAAELDRLAQAGREPDVARPEF